MPYTLTLDNPHNLITAEQLNNFALNRVDPLTGDLSFFYTYTCEVLATEAERKESVEQIRSPLTKVTIARPSVKSRKSMNMVFSSKEHAQKFIKEHKQRELYFYLVEFPDSFGVGIISTILSPVTFEKLKKILISHFDLEESSVDHILDMAGASEAEGYRKRRERTIKELKESLEDHFTSKKDKESKTTAEQLEKAKNELANILLPAAQLFDTNEALDQNLATLSLGNLFLSFNLQQHAMRAFESIDDNSPQYTAAQGQLAALYSSQISERWSFKEDPAGLSLDTPTIDTKAMLQKVFEAAIGGNDYERLAYAANTLCGCTDTECPFFTSSELEEMFPSEDATEEENIAADKANFNSFFKLFDKIQDDKKIIGEQQATIRKQEKQIAEQQEAIRQLKVGLEATAISSSTSAIQDLPRQAGNALRDGYGLEASLPNQGHAETSSSHALGYPSSPYSSPAVVVSTSSLQSANQVASEQLAATLAVESGVSQHYLFFHAMNNTPALSSTQKKVPPPPPPPPPPLVMVPSSSGQGAKRSVPPPPPPLPSELSVVAVSNIENSQGIRQRVAPPPPPPFHR